jgi:hypothetical protein
VKNIRIANVVLIKNFHEERGHWPLGRIIKYYPIDDGLVRVVDVQTCYGVFKRTVTKLSRYLFHFIYPRLINISNFSINIYQRVNFIINNSKI